MANTRRTGSPKAFWDGTTAFNQGTNPGGGLTVGAGGTSKAAMIPRDIHSIALVVTVSATTNVTLEAAHHGALTAEGNEPDASAPPATFGQVYYVTTPIQMTFAAAGTQVMIIPDFEPAWVRLKTSAAATITAGYEATGD